jgi:hypothetical protein
VGHGAHDRAHDGVDLVLIGREEGKGTGIGRAVETGIDNDATALNTGEDGAMGGAGKKHEGCNEKNGTTEKGMEKVIAFHGAKIRKKVERERKMGWFSLENDHKKDISCLFILFFAHLFVPLQPLSA